MTKVQPSTWRAHTPVAHAVEAAGFSYDPDDDLLFSRRDAWQRHAGYCYAYDLAAPAAIDAIIDCEPFFFAHAGKHWMIEVWKGQYGCKTGCEIGIYATPTTSLLDTTIGHRPHDKAHSRFFHAVDPHDELPMSFTLYHNGTPLFSRSSDAHWWLTGFKLGHEARPEDLTMEISLHIENLTMRNAVAASIREVGYAVEVGEAVKFTFAAPKSYQPRTDPRVKIFVEQAERNIQTKLTLWKALSLASGDPNLFVKGAAEAAFACYAEASREHVARVLVTVLKVLAHDANTANTVLHTPFGVIPDTAKSMLLAAGYTSAEVALTLEGKEPGCLARLFKSLGC